MAESVETSEEEARRCRKCGEPGEVRERRPTPRESDSLGNDARAVRIAGTNTRVTVFCRNPRCTWYDTPFYYEVRPDGSIPPPRTRYSKQYTPLPTTSASAVVERLQAEAERLTEPGAEIRNR